MNTSSYMSSQKNFFDIKVFWFFVMKFQIQYRKLIKNWYNLTDTISLTKSIREIETVNIVDLIKLTDMMGIIQGRYLDVSCLPSQKQSEQEQHPLVRIQQTQPDKNVVNLARVPVRHVKHAIVCRIMLRKSIHHGFIFYLSVNRWV